MSRTALTYGAATGSASRPGINVEQPQAGFYALRRGADTITMGVMIWFGPPHEPWTGEEMDRSWRWQAHRNGQYVDFDDVWPACAKRPISEAEYQRLCDQEAWARQHAPDSAYARPGRRVDHLSTSTPLPF